MRADKKIAETIVGTGVDTLLDGIVSGLTGQDFDLWDSLARNGFANALAAFISDPVDVATGTYTINTTDFILASLPKALRLERTYSYTGGKSSCLGSGWSFNYGSRIYRDTKDTEHTRNHLETITRHSLCFEKQDGIWVNQCKGTARFLLKTRESVGTSEEGTFLLTDYHQDVQLNTTLISDIDTTLKNQYQYDPSGYNEIDSQINILDRTPLAQEECQRVVNVGNILKGFKYGKVGQEKLTKSQAVNRETSVIVHEDGTVSDITDSELLDKIPEAVGKCNALGDCAEPKAATAAHHNKSKAIGMDTRYFESENVPHGYNGTNQMKPCETCEEYMEEYVCYANNK